MLLFVYLLLFFLKELSAVTGQTIINGNRECADMYPENWHGVYNGKRNTTVSGKTCMKWSETKQSSYGPANYCRSPSRDPETKGPWCYINEPPWWEFCFVPRCNKDCRTSSTDRGYSGTLNITHSGYTCHMWSDRSQLPSRGHLPDHNTELMNFCRTPRADSERKPWCYTTNPIKRWEICDVPLCETITTTICPDLKGESHMVQPKRLTGYRYGEVVTFNCEAGYTLNMNTNLKCLAQSHLSIHGKWNSSQPKCIKEYYNESVTCSPLNIPEFDVVTNRPIHHLNEIVTLRCKSGYEGHDTIATCTATSTWSYQTPTCNPVSCTYLHLNPHVKSSNNMPKFNDIVSLSCEEGYLGNPVIIKCDIHGYWPSDRPNCAARTCTTLKVDPQVMKSKNETKYNDNVTLSCKEGYKGAPTILKCYANGLWPLQRPNCTVVPCPALNDTEYMNASINISGYHFGNTVSFQCIEGYTLSGPPSITCRSSRNKSMGHWSDQQPSCLAAVPCPPLNNTDHMNTSIKKSGYHFGNNITFQCVVGYSLSGPPFITCQSSKNQSIGHWSRQQPLCLALPCPSLKLPMHSLNKDIKESQMYYVDQNVDFKCEKGYNLIGNGTYKCTVKSNSSVVDWNYEDDQTCLEKSKSCKDYMDKRCSCMSYGLFGGTLAVFVAISSGVHIATCFYFRKREGKSATVYEDMQFKTAERQNGSNDETYTELT